MTGYSEQPTLYWHDYETWGEVPSVDRPAQFAGVRTDLNLNVIDEPLMLYCKPAFDVLPKPEACLITGLSPQTLLEAGLPEYQFIAAIHAELAQPSTCGVGYNSIRFDDEVTRYTLYRNFYDPYEREWRNGNARWDIIDMLRMTRALRPDGIQWPNYDDGTPCFKLEALTNANNLVHDAAHDALSDVYATIALARLIKTTQPKLYDYAFRLRDKRFAATLIDIEAQKPLLHISSRFPSENGNAALVLPLAFHPQNKNSVIAVNLSMNPELLNELSVEQMRERLFTATADLPEGVERLALKEIHLNKTPMLLAPAMLDDKTAERLAIDKKLCEKNWQWYKNRSLSEQEHIRTKLFELYAEREFVVSQDPEQQLYAGFFSDADKRLMTKVRQAKPEALANWSVKFEDARLNALLFRYRARNFPETLSQTEQETWKKFCYARLTDPAAGGSLTITQLKECIADLIQNSALNERQIHRLNELSAYADGLV
jgi:exodeoxyribonuclease I